jgi:hypothetical protein
MVKRKNTSKSPVQLGDDPVGEGGLTNKEVEELAPKLLANEINESEPGITNMLEIKEDDMFAQALDNEYQTELDKEIKKGMNAIHSRYIQLQAQENPAVDLRPAIDALGYSSDWYYNLWWAIKDKAEPGTKEEIYTKLYNLTFTNMRKLEAIQQQYPNH